MFEVFDLVGERGGVGAVARVWGLVVGRGEGLFGGTGVEGCGDGCGFGGGGHVLVAEAALVKSGVEAGQDFKNGDYENGTRKATNIGWTILAAAASRKVVKPNAAGAAGAASEGRAGAASRPRADGPNRPGSRGSPATQRELGPIRDQFLDENPGWSHRNGGHDRVTGDRLPEYYTPGPGGGRLGSSRTDLTFRHDATGTYLHINTVDTLSNGVTPTIREVMNAWRFKQLTGHVVIMIPKGRR